MKRGGGRRYYRPDDVELLRGIRHLLYGEGYTIRGVQRILKDNGVKFVQAVWKAGAPQPVKTATDVDDVDGKPKLARPVPGHRGRETSEPEPSRERRPDREYVPEREPVGPREPVAARERLSEPERPAERGGDRSRRLFGLLPSFLGGDDEEDMPSPEPAPARRVRFEPAIEDEIDEDEGEDLAGLMPPVRPAPRSATAAPEAPPQRQSLATPVMPPQATSPQPVPQPPVHAVPMPPAVPAVAAPMAAAPAPAAGWAADQRIPREDLRKLQATLYELGECRRLIDSALRGEA